jgi:multicomponent Na+:H+ antiporter subunit E
MQKRGSSLGRTVALAILLAVFWLLLSGRIGLQYFIFMACSVGLILWMNPERPFRVRGGSFGENLSSLFGSLVALLRYLGWLLWNVVTANIDVAYRILHPRLPIRPQLLVFQTELEHEVAQVLVANSITLTPGTVTIDLKDGEYLVHALHPETTGAVKGGGLQNMVGPIFGEGPEPPPEILWGHTLSELRDSTMAQEYRGRARELRARRTGRPDGEAR